MFQFTFERATEKLSVQSRWDRSGLVSGKLLLLDPWVEDVDVWRGTIPISKRFGESSP